jgi:hypothetical protein
MSRTGGVFLPQRGKYLLAKCTQATTAAPAFASGNPQINDLGGVPTLARTSIGLYTITLTGAFTVGKTFARINGGTGAAMRVFNIEYDTSGNVITVNVFDLGATPALADSGNFDLEITVLH